MKKIICLLAFTIIIFMSCNDETNIDQNASITLKFTHNWDGLAVTSSDFSDFKFTTENGESVSIEKLRYLVSNIYIKTINNESVPLFNRALINLGEDNTSITVENIPKGNYSVFALTFGLSDADNIDGIYQDLNSASFNVPEMLGGGYHFMQFDGKYKDTNNLDANFNYHTIRAVDRTDTNNLLFQDTSFVLNLGALNITNDITIEIKMDISEWFKNPKTWDLNELNTVLMPNFEAQKLMSVNGKSVFSLGEITQ
jgi:hypothetical protein